MFFYTDSLGPSNYTNLWFSCFNFYDQTHNHFYIDNDFLNSQICQNLYSYSIIQEQYYEKYYLQLVMNYTNWANSISNY